MHSAQGWTGVFPHYPRHYETAFTHGLRDSTTAGQRRADPPGDALSGPFLRWQSPTFTRDPAATGVLALGPGLGPRRRYRVCGVRQERWISARCRLVAQANRQA